MIKIKLHRIKNLNEYIINLISKWELHYLANLNKNYYNIGMQRINKIKNAIYLNINLNKPNPIQLIQLLSNISNFPVEDFSKKTSKIHNGIIHYKQVAAWFMLEYKICNVYIAGNLLNVHRCTILHSHKTVSIQANSYKKFKTIIDDLNKELLKHKFYVE
jgi:hypothetical protein